MTTTCELNRAKMTLVGPRYVRPDGSTWIYCARTVDRVTTDDIASGLRLEAWEDGRFVPPESRDAGTIVAVTRAGAEVRVEVDLSGTIYATYVACEPTTEKVRAGRPVRIPRDHEYGGTFDGFSVTSDADPGL